MNNNKYLALIVRCKEEPYVTEFVNYYINEGVDKIYIIDDNSNKKIYEDIIKNEKVQVLFDKKNHIDNNKAKQLIGMKRVYKNIKNKYEWIINVDMDEYITTKKKYK